MAGCGCSKNRARIRTGASKVNVNASAPVNKAAQAQSGVNPNAPIAVSAAKLLDDIRSMPVTDARLAAGRFFSSNHVEINKYAALTALAGELARASKAEDLDAIQRTVEQLNKEAMLLGV